MTLPDKRIRPAGNGTDSEITGGRSAHSVAETSDPLVTADGRVWTRREWVAYLDGWQSGYASGEAVGYDRGYAACDGEIATIQREAARIVHAMANRPQRDPAADLAAAARRSARWEG